MKTWIKLTAVGFFVPGALWAVILGMAQRDYEKRKLDWSETNGIVFSTGTKESGSKYGLKYAYEPVVEYQFFVASTSYRSKSDYEDSPYLDSHPHLHPYTVKTILDGLTPGTTVTVFYNPQKPSQSFLFKMKKSSKTHFTGAIVMLLLCVYIILR